MGMRVSETQNFVLWLIIGVLIICVFSLLRFIDYYKAKSKKEHKNYTEEHKIYTEFVNKVNQQKETEKEVARRRRVTPKIKQSVLERDNYTCQICGISKQVLDSFLPGLGDYLLLEIDHIESVSNGGSGKDEDNLQVLCWRCNRKKGGKKTNEQV